MGEEPIDVDVTVIGAGTAGTYAAWRLAEAGWSVMLLDRRAPNTGGARWLNAVVPWQFERAGLDLPSGDELHSTSTPAHMFSPSGQHSVHIDESPTWEIDMRKLCERLWQGADSAGVTIMWETHDIEFKFDSTTARPTELTARRHGEMLNIRSRLFVDASGRAGVLRQASPVLSTACPQPQSTDMCSAQQWLYKVADPEAAQAFLHRHGANPGETVLYLSETCGYGVRSISTSAILDEVGVLVGTLVEGGTATAKEMLQRTLSENTWIGEEIYGGGGLIPVRRPYSQLASAGTALIGDAAGQLATIHGSGVGFGLIAARLLADATIGAIDPGSSQVTGTYQSSFLREYGGSIAANDAVRRMSIVLGVDGVEKLYAKGLMTAEAAEPALHQKFGAPSLTESLKQAATLIKNPRFAAKTAPWLLRSGLSPLLYKFYPKNPSGRPLAMWQRFERALLGQ